VLTTVSSCFKPLSSPSSLVPVLPLSPFVPPPLFRLESYHLSLVCCLDTVSLVSRSCARRQTHETTFCNSTKLRSSPWRRGERLFLTMAGSVINTTHVIFLLMASAVQRTTRDACECCARALWGNFSGSSRRRRMVVSSHCGGVSSFLQSPFRRFSRPVVLQCT
jgi:hypothetical protein